MENSRYTLHHGDNREVLKTYPDNHFDSIVCDPPYELGFMGKAWDSTGIAYDVAMWRECWRVLKHGGHLLAFGGSRTYHRMACAIEDAGFEIRDQIMWVYGSGFPKSLNVGKAIDREAGAEREVVGQNKYAGRRTEGSGPQNGDNCYGQYGIPSGETAPATEEAQQWDGWGTALKPAHEPIVVARKPLSEGTVAANVLKWGTGGINVDGCRVGTDGGTTRSGQAPYSETGWRTGHKIETLDAGRFPANIIHDGSDEVLAGFPETTSGKPTMMKVKPTTLRRKGLSEQGYRPAGEEYANDSTESMYGFGDSGSAARFFYCAKASKEDRDEGLDGFDLRVSPKHNIEGRNADNPKNYIGGSPPLPSRNHHPTVKPTELMRYLCRLVTPPNGVVLDPFAGSGSTGKGAILEGFCFVGIEMEADHVAIAHARLEFAAAARAEAEVLERNKAGEIVITAKEAAQGKASLFDWQGGADD
jgi:DNA modification methylase